MPAKKQTRLSVDHSQVAAFRMARHHLLGEPRAALATVCSHVCGIQSQVSSAAELQFWVRTPGLKRGEVQAAVSQHRALIKTSAMRQTLHLLPAPEFRLYINALKNSRRAALLRNMARCGVTPKQADALSEKVLKVLDSGQVSQSEIKRRVLPELAGGTKQWMSLTWGAWGMFRMALIEGLICYGPGQGTEVTYVRTDRWLPKQKDVSAEEAQRYLLTSFMKAYGPARLQDFSKWSGISMKESKSVWESAQDEMSEVSVEGETNWCLRKSLPQLKDAGFSKPVLRLLPNFDPYLLAHVSKDHLVVERHYKRVYRASAWISPVVLLNGRVAGIWSASADKKSHTVKVELFEKLSAAARTQLHDEAERLGEFFGKNCDLSVGR